MGVLTKKIGKNTNFEKVSFIGYKRLGRNEIFYTFFRTDNLRDKIKDKIGSSLHKLTQ